MRDTNWVVKFNGKQMHITGATRLPRKKKKFIKSIFNALGDRATEFVLVCPNYTSELEKQWGSISNALANAKSENLKQNGLSPTEQ